LNGKSSFGIASKISWRNDVKRALTPFVSYIFCPSRAAAPPWGTTCAPALAPAPFLGSTPPAGFAISAARGPETGFTSVMETWYLPKTAPKVCFGGGGACAIADGPKISMHNQENRRRRRAVNIGQPPIFDWERSGQIIPRLLHSDIKINFLLQI